MKHVGVTADAKDIVTQEQLGGSHPPILRQIVDGYNRSFFNNARTRRKTQDVPAITVGASSGSAPSGFTQLYTFGTHPVFNHGGGVPNTVSGVTTFPIVGSNGMSWRVEFMLDAAAVSLRMSSATTAGFRFRVDGKYVSDVGTTSAAGDMRWYTLTFTSRKMRRITVEGQDNFSFASAATVPAETLMRPERSPSICFVGDSDYDHVGMTYRNDGYAEHMGDYLGVLNTMSHGISGSGFYAGGGNAFNNSSRTNVYHNTGAQMIVFEISTNDHQLILSSTITVAQLRDRIVSTVVATRAAVGPNVPIIVLPDTLDTDWNGMAGWGAAFATLEPLTKTALDALGDPYIHLVRMSSSTTDYPAITVQEVYNYYNKGDDHFGVAGFNFLGQWTARMIALACAEMAGIPLSTPVPGIQEQYTFVSEASPTAGDGQDGDLWFKVVA